MKTNNDNGIADKLIHWKVNEPASEIEIKEFWKQLRHFYRTGIKPVDNDTSNLTSPLVNFLEEQEKHYPYPIDSNETSIELNQNIPFVLLDQILVQYQKENKDKFKAKLSDLVISLNNLFGKEDKTSKTNDLLDAFHFAEGMISFDKLVDIVPQSKRESLSENNIQRIKSMIETLNLGTSYFTNHIATVVVNKKTKSIIDNTNCFKNTQLITSDSNVFEQTYKLLTEQIQTFTSIIKGYRMATLEIEGNYQPEIHDEYFEHFTWHRLLLEELNLFQPVVIIIDHKYVYDHLASFSSLIATNLPVNIVVLNFEHISVPNQQLSWEDASHQFRQELAALTISQRNVFTFQSGLYDPHKLKSGLEYSIRTANTGVCHISMIGAQSSTEFSSGISALAAQAGRYFPSFKYDADNSKEWGARFDVSENIEAYGKWPNLILKALYSDKKEVTLDVHFTYADYKVTYPEKVRELMLIPSEYYSDNLVPLGDYFELDETNIYGKIPYLWLIDKQNGLHRAAVPNVWVVSCHERLNFWRFLQELAGVDNYHVKTVSALKEIENNSAIETEKKKLEEEHQRIVAKIEEEAIVKATEQVINGLISLGENEGGLESLLAKQELPDSELIEIEVEEVKIQPTEESPTSDRTDSSTYEEPWVESDDCTSCNECTDKYANLFAYNEEKKAYLKDPSKGSYEQLVKAAENCPAACIHPGLPLNKNEPHLDKLIKRAKKFN